MTRVLLLMAGLAAAGAACGAQPLGRLFFTPAERDQLDAARVQKRAPESAAAQPVETRPTTQTITYNGIVRRNDGKATLWLNNRPVDEKNALSDLALTGRVRADGAVTLRVPETGGSIDLKVGQRAELQTGRVAEFRPEAAAKAEPKPGAAAPKPDTGAKPEPPNADGAARSEPAAKPAVVAPKETAERKSETAAPPVSKDGASHRDLQRAGAASK